MEEKKMNLYTYHLESVLECVPLIIDAAIYSKDHMDADRLFYWKILTEFTPHEYACIIINSRQDACSERKLRGAEAINCNRGILNFIVVKDTKLIRSLERSGEYSIKELHPGTTLNLNARHAYWTVERDESHSIPRKKYYEVLAFLIAAILFIVYLIIIIGNNINLFI